MASDPQVPIIKRAKFLAIASQNLDEFCVGRVAGRMDQVSAGLSRTSPDGRTPAQQLLEIGDRARALVQRRERVFLEEVAGELAANGIRLSGWDDLDEDDRKY